MDLGSIRKGVKGKARKFKARARPNGRKVLKRKVDVDSDEGGAKLSGSDYLLYSLTDFLSSTKGKIKFALGIISLIIFSYLSWTYLGWYTITSFYIALAVIYLYLKHIKTVPVRILLVYDPEKNNSISIKAIPVARWLEMDKEGVQNYHTTATGVPFYIAKEIKGDTIKFSWIQDQDIADFWVDEKAFSKLSSKYNKVWENHFENLAIPQSMGYKKAREYLEKEHKILDQIMKAEDLDTDQLEGVPEERPTVSDQDE